MSNPSPPEDFHLFSHHNLGLFTEFTVYCLRAITKACENVEILFSIMPFNNCCG